MSSSTDPPRRQALHLALALVGFLLCDGVALLALGNVVGLWNLDGTLLGSLLAVGVACLLGGMICRRSL